MSIGIAVDLSGSELSVISLIESCINVLKDQSDIHFGLFGDEKLDVMSHIPSHYTSRVTWHPHNLIMPNNISVMEALRNYRHSTMGAALLAVKNNHYNVAVSCGNTGALVALSTVIMGRTKGINRPALFSPFPTRYDPIYILDLGANHECGAQDLCDFGVMATHAVQKLGIPHPTLRLLNIGTEDYKGNQTIQKAHYLLHNNPNVDYQGFIEPHNIFDRPCDIVVCDGFSGNLVVKTVEGTSRLFIDEIKNIAQKSILYRLLMLPLRTPIRQRLERMHPDHHNGAIILGLTHTVIKSHGSCSMRGFTHALHKAYLLAREDLSGHIRHAFATQHVAEEALV